MKYKVTIRATITKDVYVEAESGQDAITEAHESFSVLNTGEDEDYTEDCLECKELYKETEL